MTIKKHHHHTPSNAGMRFDAPGIVTPIIKRDITGIDLVNGVPRDEIPYVSTRGDLWQGNNQYGALENLEPPMNDPLYWWGVSNGEVYSKVDGHIYFDGVDTGRIIDPMADTYAPAK